MFKKNHSHFKSKVYPNHGLWWGKNKSLFACYSALVTWSLVVQTQLVLNWPTGQICHPIFISFFFQTAITYAFIWYKITQVFNCFPFVQCVRAFGFAILTSRVCYSCYFTFYLLTKQQLCEGTILFKYVQLSCMFIFCDVWFYTLTVIYENLTIRLFVNRLFNDVSYVDHFCNFNLTMSPLYSYQIYCDEFFSWQNIILSS